MSLLMWLTYHDRHLHHNYICHYHHTSHQVHKYTRNLLSYHRVDDSSIRLLVISIQECFRLHLENIMLGKHKKFELNEVVGVIANQGLTCFIKHSSYKSMFLHINTLILHTSAYRKRSVCSTLFLFLIIYHTVTNDHAMIYVLRDLFSLSS